MKRESFEQVLGRRPDLSAPYEDFAGLFWHRPPLDLVALELCRLRVARLLGSDAEASIRSAPAVAAGLREEQVARLPEWPTADCFTEAEQAALAFAEQFVLDPHGVDDEMRATLRQHFSSEEVVALTMALALFDGFTRVRNALCDETVVSGGVVDPPAPTKVVEVPADADPALRASVLAEQPEALAAFLRLYGTLWSHGTVPQPLKEVARLRNARITDCGY